MLKRLFVFFLALLGYSSKAQCPQVYDYIGTLTTTPLFVSCSGTPYNLNFQSNTSWGTYTINWGDATANTTGASYAPPAVISHIYSSVTNSYVLTLTIPGAGCTFTAPVVVEKPVASSIQIPITGVTQACAPKTLTFTNSSTNVSSTTSFTWNFGDGSPPIVFNSTNAGQDVTHNYAKGTVNCQTQVTLLAENYCRFGNPSSANYNPIQIYDIDIAAITPDKNIRCWPDKVFQFTNTTARNCVPEGNIFQRQEKWNFGNYWGYGHDSIIDWSPWPPTTPITISYPSVGSYSIVLLDSNMCGVDDVVTIVNIVNPPTASLTVPSGNLCQNTSITFTNSSSAGYSYRWDFGTGAGFSNLGSGNKTFTYTTPGTYTVRLVAQIAAGGAACSDTSKKVITILAAPVANFTLTPAVGCHSIANVSFTDLSTGAVAWNWTFANGNTSNVQVPALQNYTLAGTFVATLVVTGSTTCVHTKTASILVRPNPVPSFVPFSACVGAAVTFTNNSTPTTGANSIVSQFWDFYDATGSNALSPTHTYTTAGTYTVKLITNTAFCVDSIKLPITINVKPTANFVVTPTAGCSPLSVNFTNNSISATNYLWKFFSSTSAVSSATNPTYTFSNTGSGFQTYTVTLIATQGLCVDSTKRNVLVWPNPAANFTTNTITGCSPLSTTFSNTSSGYSNSSWNFGDNTALSLLQHPNHTYTNSTLFTQTVMAHLVVTNSLSCKDSISKLITIYPEALTVFSMVPSSGCSPLLVNFISVPGVAVYTWNHGDGTPTYTTLTAHSWTYSNPGNVDQTSVVSLTAQTSNGCIGSSSGSVTVFYNPVANFTTTPGIGCSPFAVTFSNTSNGHVSNKWDFGNGGNSTQAGPSSTFTNAPGNGQASYNVKLRVGTSNNCYDSVTKQVLVFPQPKAAFGLDTPACSPKKILLSSSSTGANSYRWNFGDGLSTTTSNTNIIHQFVNSSGANTFFNVKLVAVSSDFCRDSVTVPMIVHPKPVFFITSAPDSGCSPLKVKFDSIVGVKQYQWKYDGISFSNNGNEISVFENKDPITRTINVELIASDVYTCADTATKQIKVYPVPTAKYSAKPLNVFIPNQATFFTNESTPDFLFYKWTFGDGGTSTEKSPSHLYTSAGEYQSSLIVTTNKGCRDTFDLPTKVVALDESTIEIPNAFTPNPAGSPGSAFDPKDDSNDIFHPNVKGAEKYSFSVYSRWGELIFETKNPEEGWDGYYKGKICTADVYVWRVIASFIDGRTYNKTGDILLLR